MRTVIEIDVLSCNDVGVQSIYDIAENLQGAGEAVVIIVKPEHIASARLFIGEIPADGRVVIRGFYGI